MLWRPPEPISWLAPGAGAPDLRRQVGEFLRVAGDRPWSVAWCAGAGVTGTSAQALQLELAALRETLDALAGAPRGSDGAFFFASSAGGVYAGVGAPPYDESSPVHPLGAYGQAKLDAETLVTDWSHATGTPSLIGRIANLYGPGQNLAKAQGLISQICRSHLTGQPLSIYVSLDTLRDYFFAPDCAGLIVEGLARLRQEQSAAQPGRGHQDPGLPAGHHHRRRSGRDAPDLQEITADRAGSIADVGHAGQGSEPAVPGLARARPPQPHSVPGGCGDHGGELLLRSAGRDSWEIRCVGCDDIVLR